VKNNQQTPDPQNFSTNSFSRPKISLNRNSKNILCQNRVKRVIGIPKSEMRLRSISNNRYPNKLSQIKYQYENVRFKTGK